MRSMVIELREYRQFHELTVVTDCAKEAEGRWDLLSRFLLMSGYNLCRTAGARRGARILRELLPIFRGIRAAT